MADQGGMDKTRILLVLDMSIESVADKDNVETDA